MARAPDERDPTAGIGRPGGILVAAVTAAIVFVIGQQLLPERKREAPPPPPPPPAPEVTTPPPPRVEAGLAAVDSAALDATQAPEVGAPIPETVPPPPPAATAPTAPAPPPPAARAVLDPQQKLEKEIARESWRKNVPDIRAAGDKASIVIPNKGSIENATSKVVPRTRTVVVTLPKAAALNTRRFYKLEKEGFRQLWVDQAEVNADPAKGTTLKVVLAESVGPQVDIKDDFVRVTIPHKAPPPAAEKEPAAAPAPSSAPDASVHD